MERIISEIKSTADKVVKKSGEIYELSKVKLSIANTKSDINSNFKILGEMVYIAQRDGTDTNSEKLEDAISKIDSLYEKLAELNDIATGLMNKKLCPECDKTNDINASFCSGCGHRYNEE